MGAVIIGIVFDKKTPVSSYVIISVLMNQNDTFALRKAEHDLQDRTEMRTIVVEIKDGNKED